MAKRPPKFKSPEKFNSFVFKQGGFTLNGNCLTINKGNKRFRFSYSRPYEGNVKQIRIVRETCSRFSLIIITDHNHSNSYRKTHDGASIGLDFGLKTYLTKSDGSKIGSPLFFKQYQNKIRKLNKRLSNAKKGSNNRRRRLFELQQKYRKTNDLRSDFQWKLAHDLCKQYDYIFIEDLNIERMKRLWGKKVSDLSHSSFIDKLTYVASKYGVTIHKIDKWYPSSKTCECGCINKGLSLRDRTWVCPACGAINDRDILAARNILRKGISELESKSNFNSIALSDLESQIREVLKRCLSYKIVEEVPVIKYQLETNCTFSYDKNGNIVPNPSKEWTGGDENGKWRDGTSRLDALNTQPFGFSVYAKPFLKRVIEYGNGETKVEYGRLNTEKGTYAHWLNCVTSISYNRHKQVMEVECNECTSKLFVDMIKSICNISEQVKSFVNPEQIKAIAESNEPILLLSNN